MKKETGFLCFALFYGILEAKTATQWSDLNQVSTPNPTNINVFEDSILNLTIDAGFIKNGGAYSGDITINNNHNLVINANVLAVDNAQGSALQSTIYKNHTNNTTASIVGDGTMALFISGNKQAKSLFDADNGGNILIDVYTSVRVITQGQGLFSVFRSGANSLITFEKALNVDVSSAVGGLTPSGSMGALKPIFDISGGTIHVNPSSKNNDIILKGDIFSSGNLIINFITSNSALNGKVALREHSVTHLNFKNQSTAKTTLDLANNAKLYLDLESKSRVDGTIRLDNQSNANVVINDALLSISADFENTSTSSVQITGGEWEGNVRAYGQSVHTLTLNSNGVYMGEMNLWGSSNYKITSNGSKINGTINANENSTLKASLDNQSKGVFGLGILGNANATFSLTQNSSYEGRITQSGNSQSQITIDSNATFSSYITLSSTPSFSIQMQGGSISKGIIELSSGASPTQAQINLDNATFLGNIVQDTTDHIQMTMSNNATWYIQASSKVNTLTFNSASNVDFTKSGFDITQARSLTNIDESNRLLLQANTITGNGGIFSLYGILKRDAWGVDAKGGKIATDKISTTTLQGTHNIKIFWNANNIDTNLLQANLYDEYIVVAEQTSTNGGGEFVGAKSSLGVYEYDTKLTKVEKKDENDNVVGYEWILGEYVEPTPEPPIDPEPEPTPDPDPTPDPEPTPEPEPEPETPTPTPPTPPTITLPTPTLSTPAKVINTLLSSQYKIWSFQVENLHSRLGDLRNLTTPTNVWSKIKYGIMLGEEGSKFISSKQMNTTLSFGADYSFYTPYGRNFLGGGFDVSFYQDWGGEFEGVSKAYEGSAMSFGVSVYDTFLFHNGLYIDSVLKYFYASSEFVMGVEELVNNAPKLSTHGFIASVEVGKKFRLPIFTQDFQRGFFYLKPEVGVALGVLSGQSVEFSHIGGYALNSTLSSSTPLQMRAGVDFGKRFDSPRVLGDIFATFGGEYTAFSKGNVLISSPVNEVTLNSKGLFNLKVGVGGNIIFEDRVRMYFEADSKFLGYIQPVFNLNVGVRFIFGEKIATPPNLSFGGSGVSTRGAEYIILD